jgi:GalNAc5-diNAcBac-PP-undecaprenol beta-1,3-glucosyltransferase
MPRVSVLLPTHEHAATLPYAVRSVQAQGIDDLEILICGDGVNDELRAVIAALQQADPRIRFFDLPKAPRIGELNRDHVLRQAKGEIVCIQNDDDLWLPGHIEMLARALDDADFVAAMQVNVGTDGKVRAHYFDLERPEFVEPWLEWQPNDFGAWASNGFGPIFVAHRLDAYLRLPEGWATTPDGLPTDQSMWHKFLRQPWCRARFLRWPIALHFSSIDRRDWTPEARADELRHWTGIIEAPDYAVRIWRDLLPDLGDRLLEQSLHERRPEAARREAALARLAAERDGLLARIKELESESTAWRDAVTRRIEELRTAADAERAASAERIRELQDEVRAATAAASAQVSELRTMFDAEKSAMADRIIELERVLRAEKDAAGARIRELLAELRAATAERPP